MMIIAKMAMKPKIPSNVRLVKYSGSLGKNSQLKMISLKTMQPLTAAVQSLYKMEQ